MATDSFIQLTTDGAGKKLDTAIFNMGAGSTELHREKLIIADPVSTGGFATVTSSAGLSTVVTSGLVSITSGTVTLSSQVTVTAVSASSGLVQISGTPTVVSASSGIIQLSSAPLVVVASSGGTQLVQSTAATNPWSSAPGFNMPVVSVSSGLVQVSGAITSASSGLVQISGTPTVTATAATNPWSSAPGFNMPVVSVSSGLVQVLTSGTLIVVNASSGLVQISGTVGLSTAASGNLVNIVTSSAGSLVATTSQGLQVQQSTSKIVPVLQASSGVTSIDLWQGTSSKAPIFVTVTTVSKLSSSPGNLVSVAAFGFINTTSAGSPGVVRFYNAATGSVTVGASVVAMLPIVSMATSGIVGAVYGGFVGPIGWGFGTACSFDFANTATGAVISSALLINGTLTALYTT